MYEEEGEIEVEESNWANKWGVGGEKRVKGDTVQRYGVGGGRRCCPCQTRQPAQNVREASAFSFLHTLSSSGEMMSEALGARVMQAHHSAVHSLFSSPRSVSLAPNGSRSAQALSTQPLLLHPIHQRWPGAPWTTLILDRGLVVAAGGEQHFSQQQAASGGCGEQCPPTRQRARMRAARSRGRRAEEQERPPTRPDVGNDRAWDDGEAAREPRTSRTMCKSPLLIRPQTPRRETWHKQNAILSPSGGIRGGGGRTDSLSVRW